MIVIAPLKSKLRTSNPFGNDNVTNKIVVKFRADRGKKLRVLTA